MGDTAQTCLYPAQHHWFGIFKILSDEIGIYNEACLDGVIHASGGQIVAEPFFFVAV